MPERYVVDPAAIEAEIVRRTAIREKGYFAWFTRVLFVNVIVIYLAAFVGRLGSHATPLAELPLWRATLLVGLPFLGAVVISWIGTRTIFRPDAVDAEKLSEKVLAEVRSLAGPGWLRRSVVAGLKLGFAVGVPVAFLLWVLAPRLTLAAGNRWLGPALFLAMTLLWAVPLVALLRWWTLLTYRKMLKRVDT